MAGRQEAAPPSQQPPVGRGSGGRGSSGRGAGKGPAGQTAKGPESHPIPNGTPSPPPEPAAPGGMSWAARVASASSKPAPAPPNGAAAAEGTDKATGPAPAAPPAPPAVSSGVAGVKLPPGVEGKQPSIKFGDIDPTEVVPAKEQQRAAQPAVVAQPVQPPAPPAGKPAVAAPTLPAPAAPQQPSKSAAPLPVMPAAGQPQVQRPGSFAAAAAGGKPAATAAVPVVVPPQAGMPPVAMQQGGPVRQQQGARPHGGQARGPAGQQQPGVALNPALMAGSMYAQQYGMPGMQFNMNPAAPTFGPGGVGGMMYMPGGQGYFAPGSFPQAAGWQGGQYGQYGMGPAAAMQAAAAAGAAGTQQGMAGGSTSMGAGPQQQPGSGGEYAAAGGAPKATPTVTPPRERKILRIENPDTHEVIDLSKPVAGSQLAAAAAEQQQQPTKGGDRKAAALAPAVAPAPAKTAASGASDPKKADEKAAPPKTAAEVLKAAPAGKAAAEAAAAAALKPKPTAETPPAAADQPAAAAAKAPAAPKPEAAAPAPAAGAVVPAAAAAAPAPAPKWGGSVSFKDKLLVDPAEKKRQDEEAARMRAEDEAAARKRAEEEAAAKRAEEEAKRKAEEEKRAAEETARKKADEAAAAKKAAEEAAKRMAEEAAAARRRAEEEAAAASERKAEVEAAAASERKAEEEAAAAAAAAAAAVAAKKAIDEAAAKAAGAQEPPAEAVAPAATDESSFAAKKQQKKAPEGGEGAAEISPFASASMGSMEVGEIAGEDEAEEEEQQQPEEEAEPPTGYEDDTSGRKRYGRTFLFFYGNKCTATPKGIEAETFKQLSRENMPPMPPPGGRGPRGGSGAFGPDDRWQSGRMPAGPMPGPPGMRGDARMMRQGSRRGGVEADQWERGKPLPPMPGMPQGGYDSRRGPPPGMRPMPGGPLPQLHKTQSAYKLGATRTDDPEEEQAQKRLKSLLNKITKDNFAKITGQIVEVINERKLAKTLSGFINQIFDKALTETHFAELYADLVAALNPALPHLKDDEGNDVQFRRTLLNKCQEEFEAGVTAMKAVSEREKHAKETGEAAPAEGDGEEEDKEEEKEEEKEPATEGSEEGEVKDEAKAAHDAEVAAKKAALEARREERRKAQAELQARKRMLGNIVFVGQLFKKGVLTETVMHTCIKQLLEEVEQPKPEDVECMCKLLATVGGLLDSSTKTVKNFGGGSKPVATKDVMNVYFTRIEQLARNEAALDSRHRFMLMDLIDQRRNRWRPRKEAEGPKTIEEIHREEALKRSRSAMLDRQQSGRDYPRGGPRGGAPERRPPFDNRVDGPIRAMNRTPSNDFLGPGGGSFRPGGRPGPQRGGDRPGAGPPERTGSGRGPPAPPARGREEPPAREEEAREEEESEAKSVSGGMDDQQMRSKAEGLLAELYNTKDVKEGLTCVKELVEAGADVPSLFEVLLTHSLETKGTDWDMLHALLRSAVEDKAVQAADLEKGARQLLDQLDDLSVDVPKAPLQVGAVLGELVAAGGADLKVLAMHIRTADANPDEIQEGEDTMLVGGGGAAKTLGALLQRLAAAKGEEAAQKAWQATGEALPAFLPQGDRESEEERSRVVEQFGLAAIVA